MTLNLSKELDTGTRARSFLQTLASGWLSAELWSLARKWQKPFQSRQVDFLPRPPEHLHPEVLWLPGGDRSPHSHGGVCSGSRCLPGGESSCLQLPPLCFSLSGKPHAAESQNFLHCLDRHLTGCVEIWCVCRG